ncbi:flavodoxin family protein [Methanogenium marinum]|uniref:Flavodoxin family protein n=1 Tax=Methanogenium marinum TaxID=348610 RepID=A0A9Q4KUH5_9EURY|nr:flavodoxin family protein [Methanogenium marinum]MDE4908317.1 flavodoxin family protein [Methanogenium marinum]
MAPQIIALLGSPRPKGNTAKLMNEAVRGVCDAGCEVEIVSVPKLKFSPCKEIFYCQEHATCAIKDDVTPYFEKFRDIDGLIVATPVMTMGIPGALKSFMDRFQVFFMAKYFRKEPLVIPEKKAHRRTLLLSIGGMNIENDFDGVILSMKAFCDIIDCPYWDEVLQNNMDGVIDITTRPDVMKAAYDKGYHMGELIVRDMAE